MKEKKRVENGGKQRQKNDRGANAMTTIFGEFCLFSAIFATKIGDFL
jgi:hypothetical protein